MTIEKESLLMLKLRKLYLRSVLKSVECNRSLRERYYSNNCNYKELLDMVGKAITVFVKFKYDLLR